MIDTNSPQEECLTASKQTDALTTNEDDQRDHPRLRLELLSYGWGNNRAPIANPASNSPIIQPRSQQGCQTTQPSAASSYNQQSRAYA